LRPDSHEVRFSGNGETGLGLYDSLGRVTERMILAESGMTGLEVETVESCRSLGLVLVGHSAHPAR
jgi:hypothetical protein